MISCVYPLSSITRSTKYPVILISLDGFRPDYLERDITPNINYLGKKFSWVCKIFDFAYTSFAFSFAVDKNSLAPFLRPVNRLENNDIRTFPSSKTSHFQNKAKCKRRILFPWALKQFLYQWHRTSLRNRGSGNPEMFYTYLIVSILLHRKLNK